MSTLGQWFFEREKASIMTAIERRAPYVATVATVGTGSDTTLTVTDPFTGAIELERLSVVGTMPTVGSSALVVPLVDGTRIAMGMADAGVPYHTHTGENGNSQSVVVGANASATLRGHAFGYGATAGDAATALGQSTIASGYIGTAIGFSADATGQATVAVGYNAGASGGEAIAIGRDSAASGIAATALGYLAVADSDYATAIGNHCDALHHYTLAIGRDARATGLRSIAIGHDFTNSSADRATIKTDQLFLESSSGSSLPTTILLRRQGDGSGSSIGLDSGSRLVVNGSTGYVRLIDTPSTRFPPNRKVGSASAPMKSYPADAAGGVTLPAGTQFYQSGTVSGDGYSWYIAWSNYGVGYVRSDLTVAL